MSSEVSTALYVSAKLLQSCLTLCDPMAPLSTGFSRQEYCSGVPLPPPGVEPSSIMSSASAGSCFTTSTIWEAQYCTGTQEIKTVKTQVCPQVASDPVGEPGLYWHGLWLGFQSQQFMSWFTLSGWSEASHDTSVCTEAERNPAGLLGMCVPCPSLWPLLLVCRE